MQFRYIGPNPSGLADFYGYRFVHGEPVEVDKPEVVAKCERLPVFEAVSEVEPVFEPEEVTDQPKKRGRPRKVDGNESADSN